MPDAWRCARAWQRASGTAARVGQTAVARPPRCLHLLLPTRQRTPTTIFASSVVVVVTFCSATAVTGTRASGLKSSSGGSACCGRMRLTTPLACLLPSPPCACAPPLHHLLSVCKARALPHAPLLALNSLPPLPSRSCLCAWPHPPSALALSLSSLPLPSPSPLSSTSPQLLPSLLCRPTSGGRPGGGVGLPCTRPRPPTQKGDGALGD